MDLVRNASARCPAF
ncbi:hypothetical protein [Streptomyces sp. NBC_01794]